MATAEVTYTPVNGGTVLASELVQNFTDLVNFLNGSVIHRDGAYAMTAALALGGFKITGLGTPTAATDAATKGYVDGLAVPEVIQDVAGAMFSGNTETFVTVTYDDSDGTIDVVVPVKDEDDMVSNSDVHLPTQQSVKAYVDTLHALQLLKSGGTMSGAIAMGTNKITGLGDPTLDQDAATKIYADLKLPKTGGTMSGAIAMGTNKITGLGTPTDAADAATKAYADLMLPKAGGTMTGEVQGTGFGVLSMSTDIAGVATARAVIADEIDGGVIVGVRDGNPAFYARRNTNDGDVFHFYRNGTLVGSISVAAASTAYNTSSDRRLKTDIRPLGDAVERVLALRPVTHRWVANPDLPAVDGFIADEAMKVVPHAVQGEPDGVEMQSIDYGKIVPLLTAALQEAIEEIRNLQSRLSALEG